MQKLREQVSVCIIHRPKHLFTYLQTEGWRGGATSKTLGLAISRSRVQILFFVSLFFFTTVVDKDEYNVVIFIGILMSHIFFRIEAF